MKKEITKVVKAQIVDFGSLTSDEQDLLSKAACVRNNAQVPYSRFCVGAAVLSNEGTVHVGCNVERCTFTQTTHAEQNAIDTMVSQLGSVKVEKIAIVGAPLGCDIGCPPSRVESKVTSFDDVAMPCGHCLQIIWENCYDDKQVKIMSLSRSGEVVCTTIGDLLPMRFGPRHLGIDYSEKTKKNEREMSL